MRPIILLELSSIKSAPTLQPQANKKPPHTTLRCCRDQIMSQNFKEPSFWLEAAPLPTLEEIAVQKTCDVAIIGAAFVGLRDGRMANGTEKGQRFCLSRGRVRLAKAKMTIKSPAVRV